MRRIKKQSPEHMQDELFRKMSPEQKIKLASDFFKFARLLNPQYEWNKKDKNS